MIGVRNPNGFGTIVYLGDNLRRPWAIRVTDKWVNGKQKRRYIGYYALEREARNALDNYNRSPTIRSNATFKELYDEWSAGQFKRISKQTVDNYRAAFIHLAPLHKLKFCEIRAAQMQAVIDSLDRSRSTKEKVRLLCNQLYKFAMENDIVHKNYAEFIKLNKEEKTAKKIFTDIEIKKLFDNDGVDWVDSILVMIYTGMRIQEMLNLTRFDIDLENMMIRGGIKTDAGKDRVIPIHPKIQKYIIERCKSDRLFPLKQSHYREGIYYPILEQLGIEKKSPHSCRHTFATLLARAKVDTLAIEQLMGHTDYAFTANVYTHTDVDFLTNAIQNI